MSSEPLDQEQRRLADGDCGERLHPSCFRQQNLRRTDYILKPLKPDRLADRLFVCYAKKQRLKPVTDLLDAQDYEAAIAAAELLLKQDGQPLMLDLYRLIGEAAIASENYLRAYDAYQHILVDYPEIPWARLGAAKAYYHLERFDESQEILESLIKDNPDYLQSHDWLARIHALRGNEEDAKDLLKDIFAQEPQGPQTTSRDHPDGTGHG